MSAFNIQQSWYSKFFLGYFESHFTGAEKDTKMFDLQCFEMFNGVLLSWSLSV
jgi:hypothetical protein